MPRDLSGTELVVLLRRRYGYNFVRQRGSHMRLVSTYMGYPHLVAVPRHSPLRVGTLDGILGDVAEYLGIGQDELMQGTVWPMTSHQLPPGGLLPRWPMLAWSFQGNPRRPGSWRWKRAGAVNPGQMERCGI